MGRRTLAEAQNALASRTPEQQSVLDWLRQKPLEGPWHEPAEVAAGAALAEAVAQLALAQLNQQTFVARIGLDPYQYKSL